MSELFRMEANTVVPVAQRGENEGGWWRKKNGSLEILPSYHRAVISELFLDGGQHRCSSSTERRK